jgi:nitrite reductase (NO-forming)
MNTHAPIRLVVLIALLAPALTVCTSDASPEAAAPPINEAAAGPILGTLEFEGFELEFQPATMQVDQPGRYAVTFTNTRHTAHDWVVPGTRLVAQPGHRVSGEIVVPADGLEFVCSFPGHAPAGMRGSITVNGAADEQSGSADAQEEMTPASDRRTEGHSDATVVMLADERIRQLP